MKLFKKPVFVSVSPNAQKDDVFLALKLLFSPWRWIKGEAPQKLTEKIKNYFGVKSAFVFDSGRTSLYAILSSVDFREGGEVLVQAFTCVAAVNPILWIGAKPVYVDIEENTFNMSPDDLKKKITPRSRAIIIQHTFGMPGKIEEIASIAKKRNLTIIEDCAHALGAIYKNKKVGVFGDAAFFSFGRYKIISSVFGGAAITNNPKIAENLKKFHENCAYPSRFWIFQQLFHPIFLSVAKPFYNFFSLGKIAVVAAKKLKLLSLTVYSEEKSGGRPGFGYSKMPNCLAVLGLNQFQKLENFNRWRAEIVQFYIKSFRGNKNVNFPEIFSHTAPAFLVFPIQVQNGDLVYKLIGFARKNGIYLENWPAKKVVGPKGTDLKKLCYIDGSCPTAESAALKTVVLPANPNINLKDAGKIVKIIEEFL